MDARIGRAVLLAAVSSVVVIGRTVGTARARAARWRDGQSIRKKSEGVLPLARPRTCPKGGAG